MPRIILSLALAGAISAVSTPGRADDAGRLAIELNRVDQMEASCRFTFLAENTLGADATALTLEAVIIDAHGVVDRLTLFEFGALPDGVPRVRQFDVPALDCTEVGQVLINGISECEGVDACGAAMALSHRTGVELLG